MEESPRARKQRGLGKLDIFPEPTPRPRASRRSPPCRHFDSAQGALGQTSSLQKPKGIHSCCFKPQNLWKLVAAATGEQGVPLPRSSPPPSWRGTGRGGPWAVTRLTREEGGQQGCSYQVLMRIN